MDITSPKVNEVSLEVSLDDKLEDASTSMNISQSRTLADCLRHIKARPKIVCVEGNIGCGKSTMLDYFQGLKNVQAVHEPINKWTDFRGHNALDLLYKNASRWNFSFNLHASLTRVHMHETQQFSDMSTVILERSVYSTRYCFAESSYQAGELHRLEYEVFDSWFKHLHLDEFLPVDLFVYLRASPVKCFERLKRRSRKEEDELPLAFIENLHMHHEALFVEKKFPLPAPVLVLDANSDMPEMEKVYQTHQSEITSTSQP